MSNNQDEQTHKNKLFSIDEFVIPVKKGITSAIRGFISLLFWSMSLKRICLLLKSNSEEYIGST
jgi:hypothetical protein